MIFQKFEKRTIGLIVEDDQDEQTRSDAGCTLTGSEEGFSVWVAFYMFVLSLSEQVVLLLFELADQVCLTIFLNFHSFYSLSFRY